MKKPIRIFKHGRVYTIHYSDGTSEIGKKPFVEYFRELKSQGFKLVLKYKKLGEEIYEVQENNIPKT